MKAYPIVAVFAATALSAPAMADTFAGSATPTVHSTDPGLVLTGSPGTFSVDLDLDPLTATPNSALVNNLFAVGTNEGTVNLGEDTTPYPVSVLFSFANPFDAAGAPLTGQSFGFIDFGFPGLFGSCGPFAGGCGTIHWSSPQTFSFGNGGSFSVALHDVTFGTPGSAGVSGTFTMLTPSVPEPSTWAMMLLGFGVMGFAMRRRPFTRTTVVA